MGDDDERRRHITPPPFDIYVNMAQLERHLDDDQRLHDMMSSRIGTLERDGSEMKSQLKQGAKTFEELRTGQKELEGTVSWPFWKVGVIAGGIVAAIAAGIVFMARMPGREEVDTIHNQVGDLRMSDVLHTRSDTDLKSAVDSINAKLDVLLKR